MPVLPKIGPRSVRQNNNHPAEPGEQTARNSKNSGRRWFRGADEIINGCGYAKTDQEDRCTKGKKTQSHRDFRDRTRKVCAVAEDAPISLTLLWLKNVKYVRVQA